MINFVFLGAPGTGKGTQAGRLAKEFNILHISTGDLLRNEMKAETPLGLQVKDIVTKGLLVSDDLINQVIKNGMEKDKSYILDGYPRTVPQAEFLDNFFTEQGITLSTVVNFELSREEIVKRLSGRRKCLECGTDYNLYYNPTKKADTCDKCNASLYKRPDDEEEVIKNRLVVYENETKPLLDYYAKKGLLQNVNASRSITEIFNDLCKIYRSFE